MSSFDSTSHVYDGFNITDTSTWVEPINIITEEDDNDYSSVNVTNGSSALISPLNQYDFLSEFHWNFIVLFVLGLMFVVFLISIGIWYWYKRVRYTRRRHSLPLTVSDYIETTKIQEKHSPFNSINMTPANAPPVPPRPTAYRTILGKIEYRSNL